MNEGELDIVKWFQSINSFTRVMVYHGLYIVKIYLVIFEASDPLDLEQVN